MRKHLEDALAEAAKIAEKADFLLLLEPLNTLVYHPGYYLDSSREAVEIGPRGASKGRAVERLMAHQPFQGRRPIFVGDDFTDEAGMEAAREFGGQGLRVAEVFGGEPAAVRAWLGRGAELLAGRTTPTAVSAGATR